MATDRSYLQNAYQAFVASAIQRVARSGDQQYLFHISADELKKAYGLERLREATVEEVKGFFERKGVVVNYEQGEGFQVYLDLNRASLTPDDARNLAIAFEAESAR